jgi:hypothetical protein
LKLLIFLLFIGISVKAEIKITNYSELWRLADTIAMCESSMNPDIINEIGSIGLFQFRRSAMIDLGIEKTFINFKYQKSTIFSKTDQYIAFAKYTTINLKYLRKYKRYIGKRVHKIRITKSGLIAASILAGAKGVKNWIDYGTDCKDLNNTCISNYMKRFQKYRL